MVHDCKSCGNRLTCSLYQLGIVLDNGRIIKGIRNLNDLRKMVENVKDPIKKARYSNYLYILERYKREERSSNSEGKQ